MPACLLRSLLTLAICWSVWFEAGSTFGQQQPPRAETPGGTFAGRLKAQTDQGQPLAVRNDVAQAGEEIVTLRYFKIKKGSFDQFVRASREDVWPFFEKLGARVIGMWQVFTPSGVEGLAAAADKDYDEVYLSTRYASLDHWKASREPMRHGGNGPDWQKCKAGLDLRQSLTLSTSVVFLKGEMATNGPYFMPAVSADAVKEPAKK